MCGLLKKIILNGLKMLLTLSKIDLKSMLAELTLPHRKDIWKDDMIKNISDAILDVHGDASTGVFALIEEEERNEGAINILLRLNILLMQDVLLRLNIFLRWNISLRLNV